MPMQRHVIRHPVVIAVCAWLAWSCLGVAVMAQDSSSAGDTVYHLHGVVSNAVTGQPIGHALVQSPDRRLATLTDSEGKFAIDVGVPVRPQGQTMFAGFGRYGPGLVLTAGKPGYLEDLKEEKPIPLDDSSSSTIIQIELMPAAVIDGHVSVRGAEVPRNVRVALIARTVSEGSLMWVMRGQQTTNKRGEFRFSNLRPGEYTLMTEEWLDEQAGPRPLPGTVSQKYEPLFFGDVPDLPSATRLHLHFGQTTQAEFHLDRVTCYPVTIPLAGRSGNVGARVLNHDASGGDSVVEGYELRYNSRSQAIEGSLPSGSYDLLITSFGAPPTYAELPIHVDGGPLRTGTVTLQPPVTIPVHVRYEFTANDQDGSGQTLPRRSSSGSQQTPPVNIRLRPANGFGGTNGTRYPDGSTVLENVPPGSFQVEAQIYNGYIASMTSGGVDLTQRPLVVAAGSAPEPVEIVLRNDMGTVSGTVSGIEETSTRNQAVVMFVPADAAARFQQTFVNRENKFTMRNLAPGSYRILAFRDIREQLAFHDEVTMRHFEGKGTTVTVAAGESAQADVALLESPEVEDP